MNYLEADPRSFAPPPRHHNGAAAGADDDGSESDTEGIWDLEEDGDRLQGTATASNKALADRQHQKRIAQRKALPKSSAISAASGSSPTTRDLDMDLAKVRQHHLGTAMPTSTRGHTKAGVLTYLNDGSVLAFGQAPRFSKYEGSVQWRNGCALWVNVGGRAYSNNFLQGGRQITWFADSRQHSESPVIARLLKKAKERKTTDGANGGQHTDPVLLFCRAEPGS